MISKASYILVGFFVLLLGMGLIAGVLWLSTGGPPKDYDYYLVFMTESVSGLSVDSAVKYKGVSVGRVREIGLNPENPEQVRLLLTVLQGTPVNADTLATLELQGVTGIANINLSGGSRDSLPLEKPADEPYPVIPSRPSLLTRLDDTVSELLGNLIETSARLNLLLDAENRGEVSSILASSAEITRALAAESGRLDGLITNIEGTVAHTREATARLPALMDQINDTAAALEDMATSLAETGTTLQETSHSLHDTVVASGRDLSEFTANALPEATMLVAELRSAARSLRAASEQLEQDPSVLVFGPVPSPPGPGEK